MGKKLVALFLITILISGIFSTHLAVKAETADNKAAVAVMEQSNEGTATYSLSSEPSDKALETAIKTVKSKIQIPKEFTEFNFYYYGTNTNSNICWSLNWRDPKEYDYLYVSLDKDYNIVYYYRSGNTSGKTVPSYRKNELLDKAKEFIRSVSPQVYMTMEFVDANYDNIYSNTYTYKFRRKEKGVIFPDNTVSVSVDANTGEVISASIDWLYDAKIPSPDAKITKEEAADIIGKNLKMKLSYKTNYYSIYNNGKSETVKKAFLVYEPDVSYISVDAKTGEVYLTRNEWVAYGSIDEAAKSAESNAYDAGSAESASLTEEEIAKIRELENLISKNKAIEIVTSNPYLYIDKNLISYTATLHKTYMTSDKEGIYVWRIELEDNRPVDYSRDEDTYRAYANATVDAKTGKILSFHASLNSSYDNKTGTWNPVKIKYNKEEGKSIFEKFLNGQIKDRFDKTKLVNQTDDYIAYYNEKNEPVYGGYYYAYNRYNEGVEFPYNGIYGSVDGVTGKIYSYYFYWDDDVVFESPKNAITPEEAFKHYIAKDGFDLMYEVNVINQYDPDYKSSDRYYEYSEAYSVNYEVRLVYRPDINPGYISPFTGEQLDYNGEVYKNENAYVYEDIAETDENRQILILADMNIGFEGGTFKPDQAVTHEEVSQILKKLGYYLNDEDSGSNSSKPITREELAYDFISRLELKKIAKLSGIYKTDYSDENNISREYLGAVALAKALDIFPEYEDNLFNPKQNVTRREFVGLTFKLIKAANNINNY